MTAVVRVAVPTPVHRLFDYRWVSERAPTPGTRVLIPFGPRRLVGIVWATATSSDIDTARLRSVIRPLDDAPVIDDEIRVLLEWASDYYRHPIGEVVQGTLPVLLRQVAPVARRETERFRVVAPVRPEDHARAPVRQRLLQVIAAAGPGGLEPAALVAVNKRWRAPVNTLIEQGSVERVCEPQGLSRSVGGDDRPAPPTLSAEQQQAVDIVTGGIGTFLPVLLNGVTGSGKTEVYLRCIARVRARGGQTLVLVPEIALTPQLVERFNARLGGTLAVLHSGLSARDRLEAWNRARFGEADVVIGTRSAVTVSLPRLGLVVVDEEHDASLKQQDGFRYHARDVALVRARNRGCPLVLGSATPSFETLRNVRAGRFRQCRLTLRAGEARPPRLALLDIRRRPLVEGLSDRLLDAIARHVAGDGQALVFLNRRGYAPTLICNDCGATADCRRCDARMTVHQRTDRLRCHHCGAERPVPTHCETCGSDALDRIGYGTERIADALAARFPGIALVRIDRDTTRRRGSLESGLAAAASGRARILVGTQMLAKGHHFPHLTLVGILDADRGLFGCDFRALEHTGQLILQVAGRAGREARAGEVLIQTRNPEHAALRRLIEDGYEGFADPALEEREAAWLPPFAFMALLRADAREAAIAMRFLESVASGVRRDATGVDVLGPAPAPIERVSGRYRSQLLLRAAHRSVLNTALRTLEGRVHEIRAERQLRWSIDVDPVDLF